MRKLQEPPVTARDGNQSRNTPFWRDALARSSLPFCGEIKDSFRIRRRPQSALSPFDLAHRIETRASDLTRSKNQTRDLAPANRHLSHPRPAATRDGLLKKDSSRGSRWPAATAAACNKETYQCNWFGADRPVR